ncbi:hypothetical protein Ae201684_010576 [Aphanomyces euteiches]|uniref:Protein kinase domain-containing protein n=1 Tax=Aphanomyces euteiches TaxID=100861 RepID=A0A6G0WXM0_9STRA|nr:hypothetical protein Ae201684_010576 [Aphanomyces euteiches]KAH9145395.1 hypothetical protein AeRB84_010748 [Aphanomyces euteiches]
MQHDDTSRQPRAAAVQVLSSWAGQSMKHFRSTKKLLDSTESLFIHRWADSKDADTMLAFQKAHEEKDVTGMLAAVRATPKLMEHPLKEDGILLHSLCQMPNLSDVMELMELCVREFPEAVAHMDSKGRTPLHYLCMNPNATSVAIEQLVMAFPVSAAMCDKESCLPIHYLCLNSAQTIDMTMRLQHFETFSLRNRDGRTPLHCLLVRNTTDFDLCATLLSLAPEAIGVADNLGRFILHWVCAMKKHLNVSLLQLVLSMDQTAACRSDLNGQLPLHVLVANPNITLEALELVLQINPQGVDVIDANGQSPLHLLCANDSIQVAMLRTICDRAVASPTCFKWLDNEGSSALHILCTNHQVTIAMVQLLVQTFPESAQLLDIYGCTPFHYICANPAVSIDLLWVFLDKCPIVTKLVDQRGKTPLHYICANSSVTADLISIVFDAYPTSSQVMDHAMKLAVHYIIENSAIPSDMAYRLLANGSAYRLRYDIREEMQRPHSTVTYFDGTNDPPAIVYCATDIAVDSRSSKHVTLQYYSDQATFRHMLSILSALHAPPEAEATDVASLTVTMVDSFDNARKRIRIGEASPILDFCIVLEQPDATLDAIKCIDPHAMIAGVGHCLSHWHCTAHIAHGDISLRSIGLFGPAFKLLPSLASQPKESSVFHQGVSDRWTCAPEIAKALLARPYAVPTTASDVWQFGCVVYQVITGTPLLQTIAPYSVLLPENQLYHVVASITDAVITRVLAPLPADIRDILMHMLKVDPSARWTIDRVMGAVGVSLKLHQALGQPPVDVAWECLPPLDNQEPEATHTGLSNQVDQLTQLLQEAKTQLRRVELERDGLQRQLCELVDHLNVVLEEKEEAKHQVSVMDKKRASLANQLDTMVQMVMSVMPLAQQVYGNSCDDFLAHTMAHAANATVRPSYELSAPQRASAVAFLKEHLRKTILSKGCIAKWANQPLPQVDEVAHDIDCTPPTE